MTKTASTDKNTGRKRGQGYKPKDRPTNSLAPQHTTKRKLTANQWQNTPQQNLFMQCWLDPGSDTFSNQHRSALKAGYTDSYAMRIASADTGNQWISNYLKMTNMDSEHVKQGLQDIYLNPKTFNNSRSPADTRLKALELLAKVTGLLNDKPSTTVTIVQPILGGTSVPDTQRIVVDQQ